MNAPEVPREDNRAIVRAASVASKAADYVLALWPQSGEPASAAAAVDEQEAA
jgi:antirestriction protein ArdC